MLQSIKIHTFFPFQYHYLCGQVILEIKKKKGTEKASLDLKKKNQKPLLEYALNLQKKLLHWQVVGKLTL